MTWVLIIFFVFDMTISAAAVWRRSSRDDGVPPGNVIEEFLDQYYPDEMMEKIYPNMKAASEARVHATSSATSGD